MSDVAFRIEKDSLGEMKVPAHALYGAQTQRAVLNFPISGMRPYPAFVWSMVAIKRSAAVVNHGLGLLDEQRAHVIVQAADEALAGVLNEHFVVDPFQAGAGTSHNMNINEVLANRANQLLGFALTDPKKPVNPNDHVNMAQSTNDTIPAAIRLGALWRLPELLQALDDLAAALRQKAREFDDIVKSGRTHLQDAVPVRMGQEFGAYARAVERGREKIVQAAEALRRLGIGGTATGTGLNAHPEYHARMVAALSDLLGQPLFTSDDLFESMQSMGDSVYFSGSLRTVAQDLIRIANDFRLLSSVLGCDLTITLAAQAGQLELNVMMPIIAHNLFEMMHVMIGAVNAFTSKCVVGVTANREKALGWLAKNAILVTALNPVIGYANGAAVAKESLATNRAIKDVVVEKGLLTAAQADELLDARKMTEGGIQGSGGGGG